MLNKKSTAVALVAAVASIVAAILDHINQYTKSTNVRAQGGMRHSEAEWLADYLRQRTSFREKSPHAFRMQRVEPVAESPSCTRRSYCSGGESIDVLVHPR
jgi:hypothetical protein